MLVTWGLEASSDAAAATSNEVALQFVTQVAARLKPSRSQATALAQGRPSRVGCCFFIQCALRQLRKSLVRVLLLGQCPIKQLDRTCPTKLLCPRLQRSVLRNLVMLDNLRSRYNRGISRRRALELRCYFQALSDEALDSFTGLGAR